MNRCSIIVLETEKGKAVFAGRDFASREFICEFTGSIHTKEEYARLHDPCNNHFLQIDEGHFLGPSNEVDDLFNHSCNPNCGLEYRDGVIRLVAIRPIQKGEELTFDYSTTMDEDCWEMECRCGEENCRRLVRDFKHLPYEVQQKYLVLGVVPGFIARKFTHAR
jgi:hypothetical protein